MKNVNMYFVNIKLVSLADYFIKIICVTCKIPKMANSVFVS